MQVPKKLLKQLVSSTKKNYQEQFKSLYVNESEGYVMFMPSGYQCFFIAFNGSSLPERFYENAIKQITCKTLEAALPEFGDMVDLSELYSSGFYWEPTASKTFNTFLSSKKSLPIPTTDQLSYNLLTNMTSFLKAALTETKASAIKLNVSYIDTNKFAFKAKTSELEFLCITAPIVS